MPCACNKMLVFLLLAISTRTLLAQNATEYVQSMTSFTVTNFSRPELVISGNTIVQPDGSLWMTANARGLSGESFKSRAVYAEPVLIFDAAAGTASSFNTSFTFAIVSVNGTKGDGMTFILTADQLVPASIYSAGGTMALYDVLQYNGTNSSIHAVAVELDTYSSPDAKDPPGDHVGVDINSFISAEARSLRDTPFSSLNTSSSAQQLTAWIDYDAVAGQLDVFLAAAPTKASATLVLSYGPLALAQYLLNRSYVGFTAATGSGYEVHVVSEWNFSSRLVANPLLAFPISPSGNLFPPSPAPDLSKKKASSAGIITGLVLGGAGIVFAVCVVALLIRREKRKRRAAAVKFAGDGHLVQDVASAWMDLYAADVNYGPRRFSYKEMIAATNKFDVAALLGHGGFGNVYKGEIAGAAAGTTIAVAVKRVSQSSKQGEREFRAEVLSIGRLRHRNLVPLLGWCHDHGELLLVYELMSKGSLDRRLHSHIQEQGHVEDPLEWTDRYNVLCGVASALLYLHVEWDQCIVHRDIKASNVMLDAELNARLGDFGLARLVDHRKKGGDVSYSSTTAVAGTRGYIAPEMVISGKATTESDIFSFGVLALAVATGHRPYVPVGNDEEYLVDWVWSMHETIGLMEVVDPRMQGVFDREQVHRVLQVGLLCTHPDPKTRLATGSLLQALRGHTGQELPQLPKCRPVAVYLSMFEPPQDPFQISNKIPGSTGDKEASKDFEAKIGQKEEDVFSASHSSTFTSEKSSNFSSSSNQLRSY